MWARGRAAGKVAAGSPAGPGRARGQDVPLASGTDTPALKPTRFRFAPGVSVYPSSALASRLTDTVSGQPDGRR